MANTKIKGITVEIGGDTTNLGKALKESEDNSKALQSELREIENALKFNPDNVELLAQKQEILTRQVEETSKALDTLKSAEKQVASQFESGEIGEEQYRAFQREIVTTESKLNNYKGKLANTENALKDLDGATDKAKKSTDDFEKELDEAKKSADEAKESLKDLAGDMGKVGAGVVAGAGFAIKSATDVTSALNSLQAQTGASDEEMVKFRDSLENLYKGNYGEDMNHLASSMAKVAQFTGETDPKKIEDMTRNLITLEDTFEMDFNETLRGVNALMTHMGLTSEEAFDYITKGAQNGLNKTDELGDNLAEYAQIWSQAGFNAEEMFTILDNGLDSGAYNLDKVNDFVKEFTISLADGRIEDNIKSFSSNTRDLFKAWQKGEATASQVFTSVITDLKSTENQQEALTLASTVWSAVGEDNAMAIIKSLNNVNDTFGDVKGTMEDVGEIKYDDLGNRFKALGRTVITDVVTPIGEDLIPIAEKFVKWTSENLDTLIPIVKTLGITLGTIFVVNKVSTFINSIKTLKDAFKTLGTTLSANPIGLFTTAIGLAVGAIVLLQQKTDEQIKKTWGLTEEEKKLIEQINAETDAIKSADDARKKANKSIETEIGHNQNLWQELQTIVDKNGKIKEGYEARAKVITGMLAESLGIEIEIVDDQIIKYGELKKSIDDVIASKRAEALLNTNESAYTDALAKQADAFATYSEAIDNVKDSEEKLKKARENQAEHYDRIFDGTAKTREEQIALTEAYGDATIAVEAAEDALEQNEKAMSDAETTYLKYCSTIENYEGLMEAVASGDANALSKAMRNLSNDFVTAETASKSMLENQVKDFRNQYETLKQAVELGMPGVSQAQVDEMGKMYNEARAELAKFEIGFAESGKKSGIAYAEATAKTAKSSKKAGEKVGKSLNDGLYSSVPKANENGTSAGEKYSSGVSAIAKGAFSAGEILAKHANKGLATAGAKATGTKKGSDFASGVSGKAGSAKTAGKKLASSANSGLGSANTKTTGSKKGSEFVSGVSGKAGSAKTAGTTVARRGRDGLLSVKTDSAGKSFGSGFSGGITSKIPSIISSAKKLASSALSALKEKLGINSPSKEARYLGEGFDEGFVDGISNGRNDAVKEAENLAGDTLKALNKINEVEFNGLGLGSDRSLQVKVDTSEYASSNNAMIKSFNAKLDAVVEKLGRMQVVLDSGALIGETVDGYDVRLNDRKTQHERGW